MAERKTEFEQFELKFIREYQKSFWFEIPATRNRIFLPKSQCKVETATFDLEENEVYTVHVASWIADEKKIREGGEKEEQKIISIQVELLEDRAKAIKVKYIKEGISFWIPKSQVINIKDFKKEKEEYQMNVAEWLVERKLKESEEEKSGRILINKEVQRTGSKSMDDEEDADVPF